MKRRIMRIFFLLVLVSILILNLTTEVLAKGFEKCYHCDGTGKYQCPSCNNNVNITCSSCSGNGYFKCTGPDGNNKPCNNGYYTCSSCNGNGIIIHYGDNGEITEREKCGKCGGAGKIQCIKCNGTGKNICTRCNGTGKTECQVGDCKKARKVNFKCPYCIGTGWMSVGFDAVANDGIHNIPQNGDEVWINGVNSVYGGSGKENNNSQNKTTQKDSSSNNKKEDNLNSKALQDNSSSDNNKPEQNLINDDMVDIIDNKYGPAININIKANDDILIQTYSSDNTISKNYAEIQISQLTEEEKEILKANSPEEIEKQIAVIQKIVSSAQPGVAENGVQEILNTILTSNGLENDENTGIMPIHFEGHIDFCVPIKITINIEKGLLNGRGPIYIYHIKENKEIEFLGEAEWVTYDDGSVETLSFFTYGFSDFFTSKNELDVNFKEIENEDNPKDFHIWIIIVVFVAVGIVLINFLKRLKNR